MSLSPSIRTGAIIGLLVVGLVCSFAFHAALADVQITYTATPVNPEEDTARIADASRRVADLDEQLAGTAPEHRQPIVRAAQTGSFEGHVAPELDIVIDDVEASFVVFQGSYYRWNRSADQESTFLRVQMTPVDAATVIATVSEPYESASTEVRTAIESGSVSGGAVETGVYHRGSTYYAVAPKSETAIVTTILGGFFGYLLTPIGRGYVAVALGLLGLRYRAPRNARVLTLRRAVGVAVLAAPVALVGTSLFESGSTSRFLTSPASSLVVSSGLVAGVLSHQRRWVALVAFTGLVAGVMLGAGVLALGVFGALLGSGLLIVGFAAGVVPFGYGLVFARDRTPSTPE